MNSLFDVLGPAVRAPEVSAALEALAGEGEVERGAVFTRPEVATAILDLAGYGAKRPLHKMRLFEPSFGGGDFLLTAVHRLLVSWQRHGGSPASAFDERGQAHHMAGADHRDEDPPPPNAARQVARYGQPRYSKPSAKIASPA